MAFQSTAAFHRLSSYMVHPTKFLTSVGLAQARPNYTTTSNLSVETATGDWLNTHFVKSYHLVLVANLTTNIL